MSQRTPTMLQRTISLLRRTIARARDALFAPRPIERLVAIRILAPLCVLGFLATRLWHADDWLSTAGFHPPPLADDWRQPLAVPPVPPWAAWAIAAGILASGLATCVGYYTRTAAALFAALTAYVALADRLEAFTVSKLAPVIALALALSPSGTRYSLDARRAPPTAPRPTHVSGGCVLFFQMLLPVFYCASGICKARGDWLSNPHVLFTHLHDSYQTPVSWALANALLPWMWTVLQIAVLAFEVGAPAWLGVPQLRKLGLAFALAMHVFIGLMFGPVIWFSLLMIVLLVSSYAPLAWLVRLPRWRRARR